MGYSNTKSSVISSTNPAFFNFFFLNCSLINSTVDREIVDTNNMDNKKIVINLSISGIEISLDFTLLSDYENLVKKYQENLKLPERPLDLNTLFNAKLVALVTDPMLRPIV